MTTVPSKRRKYITLLVPWPLSSPNNFSTVPKADQIVTFLFLFCFCYTYKTDPETSLLITLYLNHFLFAQFHSNNTRPSVAILGADMSILVSETPRGMSHYHTVKQVKEDLNCLVAVLWKALFFLGRKLSKSRRAEVEAEGERATSNEECAWICQQWRAITTVAAPCLREYAVSFLIKRLTGAGESLGLARIFRFFQKSSECKDENRLQVISIFFISSRMCVWKAKSEINSVCASCVWN